MMGRDDDELPPWPFDEYYQQRYLGPAVELETRSDEWDWSLRPPTRTARRCRITYGIFRGPRGVFSSLQNCGVWSCPRCAPDLVLLRLARLHDLLSSEPPGALLTIVRYKGFSRWDTALRQARRRATPRWYVQVRHSDGGNLVVLASPPLGGMFTDLTTQAKRGDTYDLVRGSLVPPLLKESNPVRWSPGDTPSAPSSGAALCKSGLTYRDSKRFLAEMEALANVRFGRQLDSLEPSQIERIADDVDAWWTA